MNTQTLTHSSFHWDTNALMEYMLVINPAETVSEKILLQKQDFSSQYLAKAAARSKPYITVANFLAKESMELTLNRWISNICGKLPRFELSLNNFSGFPPHTIYLRIQDARPINDLKQQLRILDDFITSSECPPMQTAARPHVTVARKLSLDIYEKAIKDYAQKDFHESFIVEEMVLLKRRHQFEDCVIVNRFYFSKG